MSGVFDPLRDLIKKHADIPRPVRPAVVVDTARWSDTGAAWIGVTVAGDYRQAILRDSAAPTVGATVYVALTDAGTAPYLAFPLPGEAAPLACVGKTIGFLASAYSLDTGDWAILACAVTDGVPTWEVRASHPVGSGDYRPLWGHAVGGGVRYFTYAVGESLYYSDDDGATWAAASGIAGLLYLNPRQTLGTGVALASGGVMQTTDSGASWSSVLSGSAPVGDDWHFALYFLSFDAHEYLWLVNDHGIWLMEDFATLKGYMPIAASAGRKAFAIGGGTVDVFLQTDDPGTFVGSGIGEPSGHGYAHANRDEIDLAWLDNGEVIAAMPVPSINFFHPGATADLTGLGGLDLVADRDDGNGYGLRQWQDRNPFANWTFLYQGPGNHPAGLDGIGLRAFTYTDDCIVAALSDEHAGHAQFCLHEYAVTFNSYAGDPADPGNTVDGPFADISAPMVAQIGAKYAASYGGVALL